jgi:hypothetical protein
MFKQLLISLPIVMGIVGGGVFAESSAPLEPLYSAQFTDEEVSIEVKSTGCTFPENFTITAEGKGGVDYSTIGIHRDTPDECKAMPEIITLHLELPAALAALKEPYKLENLFVSKGKPASVP